MDTREKVSKVMRSEDFTRAEKWLLENQFPVICHPSNFSSKLYALICAADEPNLKIIEQAFPIEVRAVESWRSGNLQQRLKDSGLEL